ncbi:hypothetical protein [uncultured Desulfobacter sp.]|uniref:hypothetical protein n=1 Tax=uncultured Desulfobacter sp. TaxID=240139 RepID=UPI0029F5869B|nr:hypothetical protein [uncultured Desulfobacter sp.]
MKSDKKKGFGSVLKEHDPFLDNHKLFNPDLQLPDKVVDEMLTEMAMGANIRNKKDWKLALGSLIANLITGKRKALAISRDVNSYTGKKRYSGISPKIVKLIKFMEDNKMIETAPHRHYTDPKKKHLNRLSLIWRTPKLMDYIKCLPAPVILRPKELVELKGPYKLDNEGKKVGKRPLINYNDNKDTRILRRKLEDINYTNEKAKIRLFVEKEWVDLHTIVKAVFIENFDLGGRLYSIGYYNYQKYSGDDRARIQINGDDVIELDYSGLHPRMLYAAKGIQYNDDPYSVVDPNPDLRPFLKNMMLTMINSKTPTEANRAANEWLNFKKASEITQRKKNQKKGIYKKTKYWIDYDNLHKIRKNSKINLNKFRKWDKIIKNYHDLPFDDQKKHQKYCRNVVKAQRQLFLQMTETEKEQYEEHIKDKKIYMMSSKATMQKIMKVHKPIAEFLCNGCSGLEVMNKDAKIAVDICMHFAQQKIPILPVHDSFLIQEQHKDDLENIMDEVYSHHHNNKFTCPIH